MRSRWYGERMRRLGGVGFPVSCDVQEGVSFLSIIAINTPAATPPAVVVIFEYPNEACKYHEESLVNCARFCFMNLGALLSS